MSVPLLLASLVAGALVGFLAASWAAARRGRPGHLGSPASAEPAGSPVSRGGHRIGGGSVNGAAPSGAASADLGIESLLPLLASAGVVLDPSDAVVHASPGARRQGLVRGRELVHAQLRELARAARRDEAIHEAELDLARGPVGEGRLSVAARAARLFDGDVLLLVEDRTRARQVEHVRRDFVANVSHELKTPVGGIALLAEAVLDAKDDPEAVDRFARRIVIESNRLTKLVKEIVDLSRLQASESVTEPELVRVRDVAQDALEMTSALAEGRDITVALAVEGDPCVYGDPALLRTAVSNLLSNAVNYSPNDTRVAVSVRPVGQTVEIAVADQGTGISRADQARVFERFYRVDAARSRATGGTGLGLAIVKHICTNHGGEVTLWSSPGHGSTFTIRIPLAGEDARPTPEPMLDRKDAR